MGINFPPEPTGMAPYAGALTQGLADEGHAVDVLTTHPHYPEWRVREPDGTWARREERAGVRVRRLRHYVPARPFGLRRLLSEISLGVRLLFTRWPRTDVVVAASPALFATAATIVRAKLRRVPVIVWVQDFYGVGLAESDPGRRARARFVGRLESRILRAADAVVLIHEGFRRTAERRLGVDPQRIHVVRNWSHLPPRGPVDREAARRARGWGDDEFIALHAGNMGFKQNLANVVLAAGVSASRGLPIRFTLLGDGSERAELEELGRNVDSLEFLDPLDEQSFVEALAAADVLLVNEKAGIAEMAVPSKLTSYFDAGRPVVAAVDANGLAAIEIEAAGAGVIVRPAAPAAVVDAIEELRADPEWQRSLGGAGRQYRLSVMRESDAIAAFAKVVTAVSEIS